MELTKLIQLQTDFDRVHGVAKPFFEPISSDNLHDLEHLVVCLVGEVGEFANELKKVVRGDAPYEERQAALADKQHRLRRGRCKKLTRRPRCQRAGPEDAAGRQRLDEITSVHGATTSWGQLRWC